MLGVFDQKNEQLSVLSQNLRVRNRSGESMAGRDNDPAQLIDPDLLFATGRNRRDVDCIDVGSAELQERTARTKRYRMLPVRRGYGTGFDLSKQRITIGRSNDSDIRLEDTSVSRSHALIFVSPGGSIIEDSGSTNGILVNDERVERAVLHDGDIVCLGVRCAFRYVEDAGA
jgi:hypothetical protein